MFFLRDEFSLPIRISAEKYIVEDTTVFFVLFVCFPTYISLSHAHKSSSEFFWSTKCELEIFDVFGGKRARGLLPVPETRSKGLWESLDVHALD